MLSFPRVLQHFQETVFLPKDQKEGEWGGKTEETGPLKSATKKINLSCPLWGRRAHRIWTPAGFDVCLAVLSVKKNLGHDKQ